MAIWNKIAKSSQVPWSKTASPVYTQMYRDFAILQEDGYLLLQEDGTSRILFELMTSLWGKIQITSGVIWNKIK